MISVDEAGAISEAPIPRLTVTASTTSTNNIRIRPPTLIRIALGKILAPTKSRPWWRRRQQRRPIRQRDRAQSESSNRIILLHVLGLLFREIPIYKNSPRTASGSERTSSSRNSSIQDWDWGNNSKSTSAPTLSPESRAAGTTTGAKRSKDKSRTSPKEESGSLIDFEVKNEAATTWNSKLEDDAWEILKN